MAINVNRVTLVGRLGGDPQRKGSSPGFVTFSVATSRRWKSRDGEAKEDTQWHSCVVYNEHCANFADRFLKKGDLVYVVGCIETRKWTDKDGNDRYSTEVVVRPFDGELQAVSSDKGDREDTQEREAPRTRGGREAERPKPSYADNLEDDIPF